MKRESLLLLPLLIALTGQVRSQQVSPPSSIQLTVYNDDFALIRDRREILFTEGINTVVVGDVAAKIDPTSVLLRGVGEPNSLSILEQNYQYDLIQPDTILAKSVGQPVAFARYTEQGVRYTENGTLLNATKLKTNSYLVEGEPMRLVLKSSDGTIVLNPEGEISLAGLPPGLHPRPELSWMIESGKQGKRTVEISYITDGIGWKADYVALVDESDTKLDLSGWVTLDNRSGATYTDARLALMAGDVEREDPNKERIQGALRGLSTPGSSSPQFQEQSFFEYHMYDMERPTTIREKETKQISLLNATGIGTAKEYIYDGRGAWWKHWWNPRYPNFDPGQGIDTSNYHKVSVVLVVQNSESAHLGMPLPKGRIRVYKLDDQGRQQFIGEDSIDHTPKNETLRIHVGDAFDIVGDYRITEYSRLDTLTVQQGFEVKVRNHKKEAVEVGIIEHAWSDWVVLDNSHPFTKKDAHTLVFSIRVEPEGETLVTYRIRYKS